MHTPFIDLELSEVQLHPIVTDPTKKLLKSLGDNDYALEIDNTSLESFLACDRASLWRLVFSRVAYPSAALIYGQAIHAALEYRYKHGPDLVKMVESGEKELQKLPCDPSEWRNRETLERALSGYLKEYKDDYVKPIKLDNALAVELQFSNHLGEIKLDCLLGFPASLLVQDSCEEALLYVRTLHIVWTGIIDVISHQGDSLWVVDHKTTSVLGSRYFESFTLSQQFVGYVYTAAKLLEKEVKGAILNVIAGRKPTPSGKALEFHRRIYPYSAWQLKEWESDILALVADFVDRLKVGYFPKKTLWCVDKFGTCPYLPVCSLAPELRQIMLNSDQYTNNVWNPLNK